MATPWFRAALGAGSTRQTLLPEAGKLQLVHVTDQTGEFGA